MEIREIRKVESYLGRFNPDKPYEVVKRNESGFERRGTIYNEKGLRNLIIDTIVNGREIIFAFNENLGDRLMRELWDLMEKYCFRRI